MKIDPNLNNILSYTFIGSILSFIFSDLLFPIEISNLSDSIRVLNSITKDPVPQAEVNIALDSLILTDENGYFHFHDSTAEYFPLIINKPNFHSAKINKNPSDKIIELRPVVYRLRNITIKEDAPLRSLNIPIKPYLLSSSEIQYANSVQGILNRLPSITIRSYGGRAGVSTLSVHGGQSDRLAVLFDGIQINNEQNGGADISQIPPFLLSNVEYLPQGHSSRYGPSAMTGILNVTPATKQSTLSISTGNFNELSVGILLYRNLLNSDVRLGTGRSQFDADYSYLEKGNYSSVPYQIESTFYGLKNQLNQDFFYASISKFISPEIDFNSSYFSVRNQRELSTNVYSSPIDMQNMDDQLQVFSTDFLYKWLGIKFSQKNSWISYLQDEHTLTTNTYNMYIKNKYWYISLQQNSAINISTRTTDTTKSTSSIFLEYGDAILDYSYSLASRIEYEGNQEAVGSFDFVIHKNTKEAQSNYSITLSQNYKKPNFNDLFWEPFGNPELQTEYSSNLYFKYEALIRQGQLNVDLHYIRFTDLINWRPMTGSNAYWIPDNITAANSYGFDCLFRTNSIYNATLHGSYSFLITENFNSSLDNIHQGKQLLYTPTNSAYITFISIIQYAQIMYHVKYTGSRLYSYNWPQDNALPGYISSNLSIIVPIHEKKHSIDVHLKIENLMNIQYQSIYGFPDPGRSITLTLTINEKR